MRHDAQHVGAGLETFHDDDADFALHLGNTEFVTPRLVRGTLVEGSRLACVVLGGEVSATEDGGTWRLTMELAGSPAEEGLLHVVVTPSPVACAA